MIMAANERWKSISRTLFTVGSALDGAAIVKGYNVNWVDWEVALWFLGGIALMFLGWKMLGMLESES